MTELVRTLKLRDLSLLIVGSVIGSGIFLVPGGVLSQVKGSALLALAVWLAGGLLSLLGALTYGELSAMNPKAGGLYVYIRDCFGRLPAFLFGWALFFAISGGAVATLAVAFSDNLSEVVPMGNIGAKLVSVGMILVVTAVNVWGTRQSADLQNWTTAIKVAALLVMSAALLYLGRGFSGSNVSLDIEQSEGSLASGVGLAMIGVLWAYEGWQYGTFSAGETIDAKRNFPRAFLIGMATLIFIYLLANVAYLWALSPAEVALSKSVAATAVGATVGPWTAKLVAIVIAISIFSATNANVLTGSRVYYTMARDKLFFQKLAEVHPRFGTPAFAVIAGSAWAAILAMLGDFQQLLTYVVFAGWIFYGLGAATIFVYRRRQKAEDLPYRVPGYPLTPLLFVLAAAVLVINTVVTKVAESPRRTLIAVGIIALGVPAYFIWRARILKDEG
ncbi:MAG: amino acid permease [Blastocatellia bacterium]|nr:amino acid permease [Blastocatellia bacterium]